MITIYTICYNEALMLPFFIRWYRLRFQGCRIVVYDNGSTDDSREIALSAGCEVRDFDTGGQLSDSAYLDIKNHCWKDAATDWVLIADVDELCDVDEVMIQILDGRGVTIVPFEAYDMINKDDNTDIEGIAYGIRSPRYDKYYLFNRRHITEINYTPGCHTAAPHGYIDFGINKERLVARHYKYINPDYTIARYAEFRRRMSDDNKRKGMGSHYFSSDDLIRADYARMRAQVVHLRPGSLVTPAPGFKKAINA